MRNTIPTTVSGLVEKSGVIIEALTDHGANLGLIRNTAANVTPKLAALVTADGAYKQKAAALRANKLALRAVAIAARKYGMKVRDSLKPSLGNLHSSAWIEVGFADSLYISLNPARLKVLMLHIKAYLERNPSAENVAADITAVRAEALSQQLTEATDAVPAAKYDSRNALTTRRAASRVLQGTLRRVINELAEEIDPLSDYWFAFGLNKPGQAVTPPVPAGLIAAFVGPTSVALKWNKAARAERYRIYKKVVGVDNEMGLVETREELDFTIDGLPSGKTIQLAVSAINNGGESQLSQIVTVVTP